VCRFSSVLSFCLLLSLSFAVAVGCTSSVQTTAGKKQVLTTFTVIADMAQNVAGDLLEVASLTKLGVEIHGYEPTPQDIVRAQKADLILDNGLNLELPLIQGTLNYTEQIVHCIQYETCIISSLVRKNSDIISSVSSRSLSRPQWLPRKEERSQALWIIYLKLCGIPPSCPVMGRMQSLLS